MTRLSRALPLSLVPGLVLGDGTGFIGYGKTMYQPLCAAACRAAIESAPLTCTPHDHADTGGHAHGATPPECYATDTAFQQTLAFCISKRCSGDYDTDVLERYWRRTAVSGARTKLEPKPKMSYTEALASIEEEPTKEYVAGEMLNTTSLISDEDWQANWNALGLFEEVEADHAKYRYGSLRFYHGQVTNLKQIANNPRSLVVLISSFLIPVGISMLRFVPLPGLLRSRFNAVFNHAAMVGSRHRTPVVWNMGIMPTRGQTLFISYLCLINILVFAVDFHAGPSPNSWFATSWDQITDYVANRAGVLSFANLSLMFLFSARNNFLLWVTDWSHTTYLLLHRWVGYIAIVQASVHALIFLHVYVKNGTHNTEAKEKYWYWGIIATLAMCITWPLSVLPIRKKLYEAFLLSHIALSIIAIVGCYLHVWYLYENNWGYEIWIFTAGAVWGADRVLRIWRLARIGLRRAKITNIDDEYVRIDIEGVHAHGHVYLYFPTLTWRFWENHPFSVASSFAGLPRPTPRLINYSTQAAGRDAEKGGAVSISNGHESDSSTPASALPTPRPMVTVLTRIRTGLTSALLRKVGTSIPVLVEGSYHNQPQQAEINKCTTLVCIAGGVGISTALPLMRTHPGPRARLYWGMRNETLKDAMAAELQGLDVIYSVGTRLNLRDIVMSELGRRDESGRVGIVVSGPAEMADEVRALVCEASGSSVARREVVFLDEAFSW